MRVLLAWLATVAWVEDLVRLAIALALIMAVIVLTLLAFARKDGALVQEVSLRALAKMLWGNQNDTIHISELVTYWRKATSPPVPEAEEVIKLHQPRAVAFLENIREWVWFKKFPDQQAVCGRILKILDQEGLCPSVVNLSSDNEGNWDENTYRILGQTTLLDHSLNVAEQVVKLLSESKDWHVIPDTMVAALAHDLGKIESVRGYLYSLGEHPLAAGRVLSSLKGFKQLLRSEEIERAIKLHHKMPEGLLGKTLKKADQNARQQELDQVVAEHEAGGTMEAAPPEPPPAPPPALATGSNNCLVPLLTGQDRAQAAWQAQADIFGETGVADQGNQASGVPKLLDISAWFDAARFLEELKPYINRMKGRMFMAFSMPEGVVYFQAKVLEEVARKQAQRAGCMAVASLAQRNPAMRHVLFSIVHRLRVEHDVIDRGLIKDAFFGGYFNITRKIGKGMQGFYTPFHAEPFGSIAEMEQAKPDMLRDIQKVSPMLDSKAE